MQSRYLSAQIQNDLKKKMVFVGGPRQVGKTTLSKQFLPGSEEGYLSWDIVEQRERILNYELPATSLWIFDEIHKYAKWRNYLKGIYDQFSQKHSILVTGSARLDYYRRGGDSLQGRYYYLRLNPLSVAELQIQSQADFQALLQLGGFPEPFFMGNAIEAKRWSRDYRQRLLQEDLISLEQVRDLGSIELLMLRLPQCVGSPLSVNGLREDLQVSHGALSNWLDILTRLYAIFRVMPFGSPLLRAVKKEQKHYHYDWTLVENKGARFENMVAMHLLKWVQYEQDTKAREIDLRYFRDVDGREVDFIIVEQGKPILAIECKYNETDISQSLAYFKQKFPDCEAWQISAEGKKDYISKTGIRVAHALALLSAFI